jgi:hypothetical protein
METLKETLPLPKELSKMVQDYCFMCSECDGKDTRTLLLSDCCQADTHEMDDCECRNEYKVNGGGKAFHHTCYVRGQLCHDCALLCRNGHYFHQECNVDCCQRQAWEWWEFDGYETEN